MNRIQGVHVSVDFQLYWRNEDDLLVLGQFLLTGDEETYVHRA